MTQLRNSSRSNYQRSTNNTNSSASRSSSYSGPRKNSSGSGRKKRKKKPPFDDTKLLIGVVAVIILVVCIFLVSRGFSGNGKNIESETTVEETELQKEVTVNGVSITGLTREKAKEKVLASINWDIKISFKDKEYEVPNLLENKIDHMLEEIYKDEPKDTYELDAVGLEDAVKAQAAVAAEKWDVPAENACISGFDPETDRFTFSKEKNGEVIRQEALASELLEKINNGSYQSAVTAQSETQIPEINHQQAKDQYKVIGTFTTTTTSNKDRNTNVQLSAKSFHGKILKPGEEFSFNETTGNRTLERGYKPAGAYVNGILVEEPGGGVCQVSSTLYNAVVFSGLKTTERHAHSYEPSYVTPGEDAMVSYDGYAGPDMKFINNTKDSIGIKTSFSNLKLTISIYGIPVLEDGVEISMSSKKVSEMEPPEPIYEEDNTIPPRSETVAKEATPGSRWVTNIITKKNGKVITDEFFHNSSYKGKPATIKRNTSDTMVSPSTEASREQSTTASSKPESTAAPNQSTTHAPTQAPVQPTTQAPEGPGSISPAPTTETPTKRPEAVGPGGKTPDEGMILSPNSVS